jgi:hypothetical protein
MPNNPVQVLRSSLVDNRPTGKQPGEPYVNYADMQFGVVDTSGTPLDLLAVTFFATTSHYDVGEFVVQAGSLYRCISPNGPGAFNAANWSQAFTAANAANYLLLAGGTMSGPIVLAADPAAPMQAVTKQYSDLKAPLVSPVFTGDPKAPTPGVGDNDTSIATTAFVNNALGNSGVVVADVAPSPASQGKLWFDSVGGQLYVRYDDGNSAQWVVAVNNSPDLTSYATVAYANSLGTSYRNLLRRNGGFEVWQRGAGGLATFAVPASVSPAPYTADGWYLATGANQASVVAQAGAQNNLTWGSAWAAKVQRNAGQTGVGAMIFGFPLDLDEINPMRNKFVRLSFVAQAGLNFSPAGGVLNAQLVVGTGAPAKNVAGYTNQLVPLSIGVPLTATPTRFQVNATVVVPANTTQAEVAFFTIPVGTAGADDTYYVDDVQLEVVPAATGYVSSDFERLNFQEQLLLCQRHFQKTFPYAVAPAFSLAGGSAEFRFSQCVGASLSQLGINMVYPVLMRVAPTPFAYSLVNANGQFRSPSADWSGSAFTASSRELSMSGTTPAGSVAGMPGLIHLTLDAGI